MFRIITLGGSTTYGGISNEKTWSGHLQRIIEEYIPDKKIEVLDIDETPAYGLETKLQIGINGVVECI